MVNIKLFRMVLWIACGVAASVLIVSQFYNNERPEDTATGIGGSFAMTSAFAVTCPSDFTMHVSVTFLPFISLTLARNSTGELLEVGRTYFTVIVPVA